MLYLLLNCLKCKINCRERAYKALEKKNVNRYKSGSYWYVFKRNKKSFKSMKLFFLDIVMQQEIMWNSFVSIFY